MNYLWKNDLFGPGWRIYTGIGIQVPSGTSYPWDVFSTQADSVPHSHLVTGDGNYQLLLRTELFHRSDFPVATGLFMRVRIPLFNPTTAYFPGDGLTFLWENYLQSVHLFDSTPLIGLVFRGRSAEKWGEERWPNSGGVQLDLKAGWITEFSESWAGVLEWRIPLTARLTGAQLTGYSVGVSLRHGL